jgi:hypothetical protein
MQQRITFKGSKKKCSKAPKYYLNTHKKFDTGSISKFDMDGKGKTK